MARVQAVTVAHCTLSLSPSCQSAHMHTLVHMNNSLAAELFTIPPLSHYSIQMLTCCRLVLSLPLTVLCELASVCSCPAVRLHLIYRYSIIGPGSSTALWLPLLLPLPTPQWLEHVLIKHSRQPIRICAPAKSDNCPVLLCPVWPFSGFTARMVIQRFTTSRSLARSSTGHLRWRLLAGRRQST